MHAILLQPLPFFYQKKHFCSQGLTASFSNIILSVRAQPTKLPYIVYHQWRGAVERLHLHDRNCGVEFGKDHLLLAVSVRTQCSGSSHKVCIDLCNICKTFETWPQREKGEHRY